MISFQTWPPGAVATFAAAVVAGLAAFVSTVSSVVDGVVSRRRIAQIAGREQWWTRWSFTVEKALSDDPADREIGMLIMNVLVEMSWLDEDDERVALAIAEALNRRADTDTDTEEAR